MIGVINAGSSSLKFALYDREAAVLTGAVEGLGATPAAHARDGAGQAVQPPDLGPTPPKTAGDVLPVLLPWLMAQLGGRRLTALGHRVVHGGPQHAAPTLVTPGLLVELDALVPLAPLHEPHNLAPIRAVMALAPDLPQVACFDTAFHRSNPDVAQAFALPHRFLDDGVRRFGFHGLSYEYIASRLPAVSPRLAAGRCVVLHLGSGASACAIMAGRSVASTMGFTALDGLPMGTRCGELDAGVVLYLMERYGLDHDGIQDLLYKRSGMLGLSGVSADFRDLAASDDPRAAFAVAVFCYRVARAIGSLAAALGGLDGLVFTAGVGENAVAVRATICDACAWLGVERDPAATGPRLTTGTSRTEAWVIPTDEALMIARHTATLTGARP